MMERKIAGLVIFVALSLVSAACGSSTPAPTSAPTQVVAAARKPALVVSAPRDGAQVPQGSELAVQSITRDDRGITRVELWTDGFLYRVDVSKEPESMTSLTLTQTWLAKELGSHSLQVKATNRDGGIAESPIINISVVPAAATPAPTAVSTAAPTATSTAASADCQPDAAFVSDVSVPDGTTFKPGDAINKVWRVRNSGTCAWGEGYKLMFVDGAQMDGAGASVPPTQPGAVADIALRMTAPRAPGSYTGKWKLSALNGAPFGQTLTIVIRVSDGGQPAPTRAPSVSPTPAALVMEFSANRKNIPYGDCATLKWDVDNALAVKLDNKGVVGHDTRVVCPTETKDYLLEAFVAGSDTPVEKVVSVVVKPPTKAATGNLDAGKALDLDTGVASTTVSANADFLWDAAKTLQPKNGATFVLLGSRAFTESPQDDCLNATGYSASPLESLAVGNLICFKTNAGNFGKLRVEGAESILTVKWVTW